ncbi:MAG: ATP-binding protein [Arachidicoccus sp.]|nr:ATP-binding protein [Arachidicoccus sp.]
MRDRTNITSKYGFITIVFLVLALSSLIFLISSYNRNSDKLNTTVTQMNQSNNDEEKIDSSLSLLYIAENNARMFSLYNDTTYYNAYKNEIQTVKLLIDSLKSNINDDAIGEMVADKELKTQLFLKAQSLVDSILITNNDQGKFIVVKKNIKNSLPKIKSVEHLKLDTTVTAVAAPKKKNKNFFKRVSEAILNKQDSSQTVVNNVLINSYRKDSIRMKYENRILQSQMADLKSHQKALEDLKAKEKAVLEANHNLFMNLQNLLQDIKKHEVKFKEKRNVILSKNAFSLTKNLKISYRYITGFGMLLSLIILVILFLLYKNELALKNAKLQAENYAKLKSEFTATMSHEIRTPLHSIHAFADELNVHDNKQHQSEIIDAIKLSSKMLLSVVNNILDFTKIEKGKFKLEYVTFNPKDIINEIIGGLKIQAKQKNIELNGYIDNSANMLLKGDAFHLRQILLNIISNAVKYTNSGSVAVSAATLPKADKKYMLSLKITDTGIGIPAKDIPHLFDEFSSSEHKEDIVAGSTGLGLNIVKKLVDLHKGNITVTSEVNKGSTFTIEIPYDVSTETDSSKYGQKESSVKHEQTLNKNFQINNFKVLLVENDNFNQKFLSKLFNNQGIAIDIAASAEDALNLLDKKKYDFILTDIGLPGMNGMELAKSIKQNNGINANAVIFGLTGFERNQAEDNIKYFDEWLIKPFKSQDLLDKISKYSSEKNINTV